MKIRTDLPPPKDVGRRGPVAGTQGLFVAVKAMKVKQVIELDTESQRNYALTIMQRLGWRRVSRKEDGVFRVWRLS
jgi:hypothetical protein